MRPRNEWVMTHREAGSRSLGILSQEVPETQGRAHFSKAELAQMKRDREPHIRAFLDALLQGGGEKPRKS